MPKDVKCKSCVNLREHWCDKMVDSPCEDLIRDCQFYKAKTNGDVIRAMMDEELVGFIFSPCTKWGEKCQETGCHDCVLKWLKEEVVEHDK